MNMSDTETMRELARLKFLLERLHQASLSINISTAKPWLTEEILLANKPPACMLDAMASPRTLSVTEPSRIY
jgi:hypothetical protein